MWAIPSLASMRNTGNYIKEIAFMSELSWLCSPDFKRIHHLGGVLLMWLYALASWLASAGWRSFTMPILLPFQKAVCLPRVWSPKAPKGETHLVSQCSLSTPSLCCSKSTPHSMQKRKDTPSSHMESCSFIKGAKEQLRLLPWISKSFRITASSDTCQMSSWLKGQTLVWDRAAKGFSPLKLTRH